MSEFRAIGSFAKQLKRVNDGNFSTADVYSVTKYDGFVRSLDYFKKQVFSRDLGSYKIVRKGELLLFRDGMEQQRSQQASELGLSETEYAFHGVLLAEIAKATGDETTDEHTHEQVLALTRELVQEFEQATRIVGFFDKWEEVKRIERQIKRAILDQPFGSKALVAAVTQRFMELGKRHFR